MIRYVWTLKTQRESLKHLDGKPCTIIRKMKDASADHLTERLGEALPTEMYEARVYSWDNDEYHEFLINALDEELVLT
jgi:hypothetical protein